MASEIDEKQIRNRYPAPKHPSFLHSLGNKAENILLETDWRHIGFKTSAYLYIIFIIWICWKITPLSGLWHPRQPDRLPVQSQDLSSYFNSFTGSTLCNINAKSIYNLPHNGYDKLPKSDAYCPYRGELLEAMSNGGRHGFDVAYTSRSCHYKWHNVAEICMILERFDALVFVGDELLQNVYAGLNILLRGDLQYGVLKTWEMDQDMLHKCQCDQQFSVQSCRKYFVTNSEESNQHGITVACRRTPHTHFLIDSSPASEQTLSRFKASIPPAPRSNYKSIPIIHSLTSTSIETASKSLDEFLKLADESKRKTPMLWIGPTAGHIEIRGRKGSQEIWRFAQAMKKIAREKDIDSLGLWNLTIQASNWDGKNFGEEIAIVSAMMVVNWLSRLESN